MSIIFISHKLNEVLDIADRDHGAAARQDSRDAAGCRSDGGRASRGSWSAGRCLLRVEKPPLSRVSRSSRSRICTYATSGTSRRCAAFRSRCARGRSSGSRASTAMARRSSSTPSPACRRSTSGSVSVAGRDVTGAGSARALRRRSRPHPAGPSAPRSRARLLARREHEPPRLPRGAELALRLASASNLVERARRLIAEFDVRGGGPQTTRGRTLRRQSAEGDPRAGDRPRPEGAHRRPAHAGAGRRCDRVRPSPPHRGARRRGARSCSSRSSSRRSCRCPTASSCMYEGEIVAEYGPDVRRGGARRSRCSAAEGQGGVTTEPPRVTQTPPPGPERGEGPRRRFAGITERLGGAAVPVADRDPRFPHRRARGRSSTGEQPAD